jgi:hypothetical protein
MAGVARIPRRRGGLCGLLLILLGAWGALVPFIGPYFDFAFTPDKTWAYTSGRLYLSIVPGGAAFLGGLIVLATRSRGAGVFGGLLAAVGGAWFVAGAGILNTVMTNNSITPGTPVPSVSSMISSPATWVFLEEIGFFVGTGILIVFFGALAMGRFSVLSARDTADDDYDDYSSPVTQAPSPSASGFSTGQFPSTTSQYPSATGQYPSSPTPFPGEEPTQTQDRIPSSTGPFPSATGDYPPPQSTPPFPASGSNS